MEEQLEQSRAAVVSLRRLLEPSTGIDVERRHVPRRSVAGISETVALDDVLGWYSDAMAEIDAALKSAGQDPTGPRGGLCDQALFTDEIGGATVFVPVDQPPRAGRVQPTVLAATDLAVTVHRGPHSEIDVTCGSLGVWADSMGLAIDGPVHETYLIGPRDAADESAWRTEIGWPVSTRAEARPGVASADG